MLTMVCMTIKFGWFLPVKNRKAEHIAQTMISKIFCHFGNPRSIYHDRAGEFTSELFKQVLAELSIKRFPVTPYNPHSQGVVERLNQTLLQLNRAVCMEYPLTWDEALPMCQSAYNSAYHRNLNNTAYFSFFYRDNHLPYSIKYPVTPHEDKGLGQYVKDTQKILEMARTSIYIMQQHRLQNVNHNKQNLVGVGDIVFATTAHINKKDYKILPKYSGPYRVLSIKFNSATLKSLTTGQISLVSLRNVKQAHHSSISKKKHRSVDEPFPIHGNNDLPQEMVEREIRSHYDAQLLTGSESVELH